MLKKIKENKALKFIGNILYILSFILVVLILIVVLIQRFSNNDFAIGGIRIFSVASGSMAPEYEVGDILISKEVPPEEINEGDVVTYKGIKGDVSGKIITHEVVEKIEENGKYTFVTKGTANSQEDPKITEDQIYGKVIYKSVILSFICKLLQNMYGFYFLIIVPLAIIIAKLIVDFVIRRSEKKEEENLEKIEEKKVEENLEKIEEKKVETKASKETSEESEDVKKKN